MDSEGAFGLFIFILLAGGFITCAAMVPPEPSHVEIARCVEHCESVEAEYVGVRRAWGCDHGVPKCECRTEVVIDGGRP